MVIKRIAKRSALRERAFADGSETAVCVIQYSVPTSKGETMSQRARGEQVKKVLFVWLKKLDEVDVASMPQKWVGVHNLDYEQTNKHVVKTKEDNWWSWMGTSYTNGRNLLRRVDDVQLTG